MENRNDILNELNELSPLLAGISREPLFTVPDGYFDQLPFEILSAVHSGNSLNSASVPEGYFETLADNIMARIRAGEKDDPVKEISELSPLLSGIQQPKHPYTVPAAYFETLENNIKGSVHQPAARVVSLTRFSRVARYAAAAMITGLACFGVYRYTQKPATINAVTVATLDPSIEKGKNMSEQQFNEALSSLSEEDIARYIEKTGDETDLAALASNVEENTLPNQDDYFTDEQALEKYISEIEQKNTLSN